MKTKPIDDRLARLTTLGGLLGIKTSLLLPRLAEVAAAGDAPFVVTVPHGFDAMTVTTRVPRAVAVAVCGPWLEALPGDHLDLEIGPTSISATSDEAALPADAPALVQTLGADALCGLGHDGATWTYRFEQPNADAPSEAAVVTGIDALAISLDVTAAQRRIAASLHRSLARGMTSRLWLRARDGVVEPVLGLSWDRVEWNPIQSMLGGFYPDGRGVDKIARLTGSSAVTHATVDLVLGPTDPPALRISFVEVR